MLEKVGEAVVGGLPASKDGSLALLFLNKYLITAQLSPQAAGQVSDF
jgi:hypothetical protein